MSAKHPGFVKIAEGISRKEHISLKRADKILAARSRQASPKAKQLNPRLKRVKG